MNRRALEKHLKAHGCVFRHHGANHDIWINPTNFSMTSVPRHAKVKRGTVRSICKLLGIPLPAGL